MVGVYWRCANELIQLTRTECQGGLVPAESLQVLHTNSPSSHREKKKSAHLQREHTQVVIVFIPFSLGAKASIPQARTAVISKDARRTFYFP